MELAWLPGVRFALSPAAPVAFSGGYAKSTRPNAFNVGLAELSQIEAVVSGLVLGYMFLGQRIERMVRGR